MYTNILLYFSQYYFYFKVDFIQDEIRNFLDLSTLFEVSDNIEYITLPYYSFKSDVVFLGNSSVQRSFLKDIAITQFKELFKDKTIVTNSKKLSEMEGFHFVSLNKQSQYESFIFLMQQNNHKDYMTKENYKIIFELFNKFNYEEPNINHFKLYDKINQNIIDTIKDNRNTLKNKVKFEFFIFLFLCYNMHMNKIKEEYL